MSLDALIELHQMILTRANVALADLDDEEIDWRPLPESNSINLIVRHLRIEAQWHLDSLLRGAKMPFKVSPALQSEIDAVPLDYRDNKDVFERSFLKFIDVLRATTPDVLKQRTSQAYGDKASDPARAHMIGYHQALHVVGHVGQISMIRNLYRKTLGQPARFFPENATFPR